MMLCQSNRQAGWLFPSLDSQGLFRLQRVVFGYGLWYGVGGGRRSVMYVVDSNGMTVC